LQRVRGLGGVTNLEQALAYDCALCCHSLNQGEEVRTLSCDHVFHFRKSAKCRNNIDDWLRENSMRCPACCKTAYLVLPRKAPPTSAPMSALAPPPPPPSDLELQIPRLLASDDEASIASQWFQDTHTTVAVAVAVTHDRAWMGRCWRVLRGGLDRFLERFLKDSFAVSFSAFFELIEVVRLV
jgi:hypothetical protein